MNSDFNDLLSILNDCQVRYLADLIIAKRTSGRAQDLRDLEELERPHA
jgi:hypothetical protein